MATVVVPISFRSAAEQDLPFLINLRQRTMVQHQLASGVEESDSQRQRRVLARFECAQIILLSGEPVGLLKVARDGKDWELIQIQIVPERQRAGLGESIVRKVIDEATVFGASLRLTVLKANPARRLYERLGFQVSNEGSHSYDMHRSA